jgi:hypothetical protein
VVIFLIFVLIIVEKTSCKECGGGSICPHNRQKSKCKECGGSSICQHLKVRSQCKECGGGSICPHNRQKYRCKECLADKDNTIPEVEEYTKEEYEIISFLVKK